MKKQILLGTALFSLAFSLTSFADPLATLETEKGNVSIVGFTTATDSDGNNCFVGLFEYENTTDESNAPWLDYAFYAYQDGIELEHAYIYNFSYEDFKSSDTNVRPGATLKFYELFLLTGDGPVDVEVSETFNFDNTSPIEYTFDLSDIQFSTPEKTDDSDDSVADAPAGSSLEDKVKELEIKIAELEERINMLEGE